MTLVKTVTQEHIIFDSAAGCRFLPCWWKAALSFCDLSILYTPFFGDVPANVFFLLTFDNISLQINSGPILDVLGWYRWSSHLPEFPSNGRVPHDFASCYVTGLRPLFCDRATFPRASKLFCRNADKERACSTIRRTDNQFILLDLNALKCDRRALSGTQKCSCL